jgi:hypothetical protein
MKKILFVILFFSFFFIIVPFSAKALTDTQCSAGGGTYSSGVCNCPAHSSWAGDTCECNFGYTGSKGICTPGVQSLKETIQKSNCGAIICIPPCDWKRTGKCSTVQQQGYWSDSLGKCVCPTGYYSNEAPTVGGSSSSSSGSSNSSGSGSSGSSATYTSGNAGGGSITLPTVTSTGVIPNPIKSQSFAALIEAVSNWVLNIALVLAPLVVVYGGFIYMTSAGDTNKVSQGKQIILYAVIGFIVALLAKSLVGIFKDLVVK